MGTPYFALYPTDFLADVGHLGNTELGIYWRLLLVYYRDGRPLPVDIDKLRRIAMTMSPEECRALDSVVSEFFILSAEVDGTRVWRHKRADREVKAAAERHAAAVDKAKVAASARWNKHRSSIDASSNAASMPRAMLVQCQPEPEPEPSIKEPTVLVDSAAPTQRKAPPKMPPCPTEKVVEVFHGACPTLPRVMVLNEARKRALSARWREVVAEHANEDDPAKAALDWFVWFFEQRVASSRFLTGKAKDWHASFDWLMKPTNFAKVAEGNYAKERT